MRYTGWIILVLATLLLAVNAVYVVPEGGSAVVLDFGRVARSGIGPGLHAKFPLVERAFVVDGRIGTFPIEGDRYTTADRRTVTVDFTAVGRVVDARRYYLATGGDPKAASERLVPIVKSALAGAIRTRTLGDVLAGGRDAIVAPKLAAIDTAASALGLRITDVRLGQIDLPSDSKLMADVYGRMRAQRQEAASRARAEGGEQAQQIRADADRDAAVIRAEAERDAQQLRGEGDAESARLYAEAAQKDPGFYAFERSLEAYRQAFGGGQTVIVVDKSDPFLQYLKSDR